MSGGFQHEDSGFQQNAWFTPVNFNEDEELEENSPEIQNKRRREKQRPYNNTY